MSTTFIITDLIFHHINKEHPVVLFHGLVEGKQCIWTNVNGKHEMIYFVHGTIVKLIYLMESIHDLSNIGYQGICSVSYHIKVACEGNYCEKNIY